jgi:hypothetical protein
VCHAGTEQSRWSEAEELQIDQNQCRCLKDYYGFDRSKSVAEPTASAEQASLDIPEALSPNASI